MHLIRLRFCANCVRAEASGCARSTCGFFQLPLVPEAFLRAGNYGLVARMFRRAPTQPGTFNEYDIGQYIRALAQPGALRAALHYYRAALRHQRSSFRVARPVTAPSLLLWGEQDPYLGVRLTEGLDAWVPHLRVERHKGASHWIQNEAPDWV